MIIKRNSGFSLLELLVVLAIMALLVGVVAPQVMKHLGKAKTDSARLQIEDLGAALDMYYMEIGSYPSTDKGLESLVSNTEAESGWNGPYLKKKKIPLDPWKRPYVYISPGENGPYDLLTLGKDNAEGGEGEDQDIVSWE